MIITVVGTGYVGLVMGTCFAQLGFRVNCIDTNPAIVARLNAGIPTIREQGLERILVRARRDGLIAFHTDFAQAVSEADCVFLAVGTPKQARSDEADLSHLDAAVAALVPHLRDGTMVVVKSTVPVGTNDRVRAAIAAMRPGLDVSVASNPEFLREGSAVADFFGADRVVCGIRDERSRRMFTVLYHSLVAQGSRLAFTTPVNAELAKYASNAFLALKVAYINEIADLCEAAGADVEHVAALMGMDRRIGSAFLRPGPGYGGSCFPKDTLALLETARRLGGTSRLVAATVEANEARKQALARRIIARLGPDVAGRRVAVLGVTFKAGTDDVRDSAALTIIPALQAAGVEIVAHDPEGRERAELLLPGVRWADHPLDALSEAEAGVVLTDWPVYEALSPEAIARALRGGPLFDLRNVFSPEAGRRASPAYESVGRGGDASTGPLVVLTAASLADPLEAAIATPAVERVHDLIAGE